MIEQKEEEDFVSLLIKWYLEQKKAAKVSITSDKGENNARNET